MESFFDNNSDLFCDKTLLFLKLLILLLQEDMPPLLVLLIAPALARGITASYEILALRGCFKNTSGPPDFKIGIGSILPEILMVYCTSRKHESRDTKDVKMISDSSICTNFSVLLKIIIEVSFFIS